MLSIRSEQLDTFKQTAINNFEDKMVKHCQKLAPQITQQLNQTQLHSSIQKAISKANHYGLSQQGPVRLFIEMTLLYGHTFDTDPQYPWAKTLLTNKKDPQMQRAESLYHKHQAYTWNVQGQKQKHLHKALKTTQTPNFTPKTFTEDLLTITQTIYPEKYSYVGAEQLKELIRTAITEARSYNMNNGHAFALIYALMVSLGHGCTSDPFYPWIKQCLQTDKPSDPEIRAQTLEKLALKWLERSLSHYERL